MTLPQSTLKSPLRALAGFAAVAGLVTVSSSPALAVWAMDDTEEETSEVPEGVERVESGTNQDSAPLLEPGNRYISNFEQDNMFFRVSRTMENSTLHVGLAYTDPEGDMLTNATLELSTFDGSSCDSSDLGWEASPAGYLQRGAQVLATPDQDPDRYNAVPECGSLDQLLLSVQPEGDEFSGQDFELVVSEEPDPTNGDQLRSSFDDDRNHWGDDGLEWFTMERDRDANNPIEPGSSIYNAPLLEAGTTYDAQLQPGEVHIYRVEADWNDQIQAEVFFPEPASELSDELERSWAEAQVSIISPYYGSTMPGSNRASDEQNLSATIDETHATTLRAQSYPVTWTGRFASSAGDNARNASVPGEYFVLVAMDPDVGESSLNVPYRLTTGVFEGANEPLPEYDEEPVEPEAAGEQAQDGVDASGSFGTYHWLALGLGALGVGLIAFGGVSLLKGLRRR